MPRGASVIGTATVTHANTSVPIATAACDASASGGRPTATYAFNDTKSVAWLPDGPSVGYGGGTASWPSGDKFTRVRVLMGPSLEDVSGLIGDVEVTETSGTPVMTASFTLVDTRCAYFDAASWAYGGVYVEVRFACGTPLGLDEVVAFRGYTEAVSSDDPYVPRATIRAASFSKIWSERGGNQGCLRIAAFAGYNRMALLQAYAAQTCTPLTTYIGDSGRIAFQGIEVSGLSLLDLAQRWAEVEGLYLRETDGTLEMVPEALVVGDLAQSAYDFRESNYLAVREDCPNRPTTTWTLSALAPDLSQYASGAQRVETDESEGVDANGYSWRVRTKRYFQYGILMRQVDTEYSSRPPVGYPSADWVGLRPIKQTTTEYDYVDAQVLVEWYPANHWDNNANVPLDQLRLHPNDWVFVGGGWGRYIDVPTNQLLQTKTYIYEYVARLADVDGGVEWTDGSHHVSGSPAWLMSSMVSIDYDWRASTEPGACQLAQKTTTTYGWYAPLTPTASISGNHYLFDDGSYRAGLDRTTAAETYGVLEETTESWWDNSADDTRTEYRSYYLRQRSGWRQEGYVDVTIDSVDLHLPNEQYGLIESEKTERIAQGSERYTEERWERTVTETRHEVKTIQGTVPDIATSSPTVPQHKMKALTVTVSALTDAYTATQRSETSQDAESAEDLERIAKRRLRESLGVREVISHPMVPTLRVFDPVTVTDPCRQLDEKKGYIVDIVRRGNVINGWLGQETTVLIPPEELDS